MKENFRMMKGELEIMKALNLKPNFSELQREFSIDRHTIKKYYNGYEKNITNRKRISKLDPYYEEIKMKLSLSGINMMSLYQYLLQNNSQIGSYSNFRKYLEKHNLKPQKVPKAHPRYETEPGEQLQFDWKENLKMVSKYGEIFEFNIFSATLGYSRLHNYVYSRTKTREDLERCLISTFKYIGGVPKEMLTDNMRAVVDIQGNKAKINSEFRQFVKDMGSSIKSCKIFSPETKGKDETANKFMSWLVPYNHEFENEEELIKIIENIRNKVNSTLNQTTNMPPILLFKKEKEYLLHLPSTQIMDSYLEYVKKSKVTNDSLIYYKGQRYSVSPKYIGKFVQIKQIDNILYLYHNNELIATHTINKKKFNYTKEHYMECLKNAMPYNEKVDINKLADDNLKKLDKLLINSDLQEKKS